VVFELRGKKKNQHKQRNFSGEEHNVPAEAVYYLSEGEGRMGGEDKVIQCPGLVGSI